MFTAKEKALMLIQDHILECGQVEWHDGFAYVTMKCGTVYYYDWTCGELFCEVS